MKNILVLFCVALVTFSCSEDDSSREQEQQQQNENIPQITILPITNIAGDIAKTGSTFIEDNGFSIIRKGICYATTPNPTVENLFTNDGIGTTAFESELLFVDFQTTYYARAYAENSEGIGYSEELSFTTNNTCTLKIYEDLFVEVILTNQTEIDQFGTNGYCSVEYPYSFIIREGAGESDPITDLTPLENLRLVNSLEIDGTSMLQNLDGLHNLSIVEQHIYINNNNSLENIDALSSLSSSFYNLEITRNNSLKNINGLLNVTVLAQPYNNNTNKLIISENPVLENIDGIENISIESDRGIIRIFRNELITNVDALAGITGNVETLSLAELPNLKSITGISQITSISSVLHLTNLDALSSLAGVENIVSIGNELSLYGNDNLIHLDQFSKLEEVERLSINYNPLLVDFCGLQNLFILDGINKYFNFSNNAYNPSRQDMLDGNCAL